MQQVLTKLIKVQIYIFLVLLIFFLFFSAKKEMQSMVAGSLVCIVLSGLIGLIFHRSPKVLSAKTFYALMWISELVKWIGIIVLMSILLRIGFSPLGLLLGFSITYVGSYFVMILK